jgi:Cytochrome P450
MCTSRLLARHPEVQAKLRNECLSVSEDSPDRDVLKGMKYLQCVLKEGESSSCAAKLSHPCYSQLTYGDI